MIKKLFKDKKYRYRNLILIILPFALLVAFFGYMSADSISSLIGGATSGNKNASSSIESMDYHLINGATNLQKDLFKDLEKAVKSEDDLAIAEAVAKNFVADFYTWTNKAGQFDVGGMYYVYSPQKNTIYNQARNQFYNYVSKYIEKYGQKNILEVSSVEATATKEDEQYSIDGNSYDSYYVTCKWTYVDNKGFTEREYKTEEHFNIIKNNDGRFEIVKAYGD